MPSFTNVLFSLVLVVPAVLAQSACSGQQYNDITGFPATRSGCHPEGHYHESDLGVINPINAATRCRQQCTSDNFCASTVVRLNKENHPTDLYYGTCFFYNTANTPNGPWTCRDTATLLLGYRKDNTLGCFSSSKSVATPFCSSYLGIPISTSTITDTPPPHTTTITTTTSLTTTTTTTADTDTVTTHPTTVASSTVFATETTITTTTSTSTTMTTSTDTTTSTVTVTSTSLVKQYGNLIAAPTPTCINSGLPASRLSAACSCLSISTSVTTTTTTLVPQTLTKTATSTTSVTETAIATATSTATDPLTVTDTVTVTSETVTSTETDSTITTVTTTTDVVTMTTTTVIATVIYVPPTCSDPGTDRRGAGGCSSNCYCDTRVGSPGGICDRAGSCSQSCTTDEDCPAGAVCAISKYFQSRCGGPQCLSTAGCTTTSNSQKTLFGLTGEEQRAGRMQVVINARAKWAKRNLM